MGEFLIALVAMFLAAKIFGELAERVGQPAVLGELVGGVIVGVSGLHLVDPHKSEIHLLSELGVIFLLFLIGLETDLLKLLAVGVASSRVAIVGVVMPFLGGWLVGYFLGLPSLVSIFLGAALTATSVGITARVLSDLGYLQERESQIVLGAAVIDDILGLILLTVVGSLAAGHALTLLGVGRVVIVAFGFVIAAIVIGSRFAPTLIKLIQRLRVAQALFFFSIVFAFSLALLADRVGSAMIIGAFAAGLVLARTEKGNQIQREVHDIASFFIPIFFVSVGASIDLRTLNPFEPEARRFLLIGLVLTAVGVVGKLMAGWAVSDRKLRRIVIGVGMVPRGEVGLIFANIGIASGILSTGLYSSVALMVMLTTFVTPPALRALLLQRKSGKYEGVSGFVVDAPFEDDTDFYESAEGEKTD